MRYGSRCLFLENELRKNRITQLDIVNSLYKSEGEIELLLNALSTNTSVTTVLFHASFDDFLQLLFENLSLNTSVNTLILDPPGHDQEITDEKVTMIIDFLSINRTIREFVCFPNLFYKNHISNFLNAISQNHCLKVLILPKLAKESLEYFLNWLKSNNTLKKIAFKESLSDDFSLRENFTLVKMLLERNIYLQEFLFTSGFYITDPNYFFDLLGQNGSITKFGLFGARDTSDINLICKRNLAMHKRAKQLVITYLMLHKRGMVKIVKDVNLMICKIIWSTRIQIEIW